MDVLKNKSVQESLNVVAKMLNVEVEFLVKLITKETAGTWNPQIKNPISSARGLIQFMDATAQDMGYSDSLHLVTEYSTIESQLENPVYSYLRKYAPFATNAELYLSVFYPAYRKQDYRKEFPENVIKSNPRIKTPAHYVAFVEGKLSDLESGKIKPEELIKKNKGYTKTLYFDEVKITPQDIVPGQEKKKIFKTAAIIAVLTIAGTMLYTQKR